MSRRCKLRKEFYKEFGNYKGNGNYSDTYVIWLESLVLENISKDLIPKDQLCSSMCCENKAVSIGHVEIWYNCEHHKN